MIKSEKLTLNGEKILEPDCCFEGFFDGVSFTLFARGKSNASSTTDGIVASSLEFRSKLGRRKRKKLFSWKRFVVKLTAAKKMSWPL